VRNTLLIFFNVSLKFILLAAYFSALQGKAQEKSVYDLSVLNPAYYAINKDNNINYSAYDLYALNNRTNFYHTMNANYFNKEIQSGIGFRYSHAQYEWSSNTRKENNYDFKYSIQRDLDSNFSYSAGINISLINYVHEGKISSINNNIENIKLKETGLNLDFGFIIKYKTFLLGLTDESFYNSEQALAIGRDTLRRFPANQFNIFILNKFSKNTISSLTSAVCFYDVFNFTENKILEVKNLYETWNKILFGVDLIYKNSSNYYSRLQIIPVLGFKIADKFSLLMALNLNNISAGYITYNF